MCCLSEGTYTVGVRGRLCLPDDRTQVDAYCSFFSDEDGELVHLGRWVALQRVR